MTGSWRYSLSVCLLTVIMPCSCSYSSVCLSVFWLNFDLFSKIQYRLSLWLIIEGTVCLSFFWLSWEWFLKVHCVCLSSDKQYFRTGFSQIQNVCLSSDCHYDSFLEVLHNTVCLTSDCHYDWFLKVQSVCLSSDCHYDLFLKLQFSMFVCLLTDIYDLFSKVQSSMCVCLLTGIMTGSWRYIMSVFLMTFMRNGSWRFFVSVCLLAYNTVWLGSHRCRIFISLLTSFMTCSWSYNMYSLSVSVFYYDSALVDLWGIEWLVKKNKFKQINTTFKAHWNMQEH